MSPLLTAALNDPHAAPLPEDQKDFFSEVAALFAADREAHSAAVKLAPPQPKFFLDDMSEAEQDDFRKRFGAALKARQKPADVILECKKYNDEVKAWRIAANIPAPTLSKDQALRLITYITRLTFCSDAIVVLRDCVALNGHVLIDPAINAWLKKNRPEFLVALASLRFQ